MSEQFEMHFGAPKKTPEAVPDANADVDEMDAHEIEELIETLERQITANRSSDPEWTKDLEERLARAQGRKSTLTHKD